MIYYDERSWITLVFRFHGTAWESTWHLVFLTFLLSLFMYLLEIEIDYQLASEGHTIFASTMSYLLVFRANNASDRYWLGRCYLTQLFSGLREFVMGMCVTCRGGQASQAWLTQRASKYTRAKLEDAYDLRASMARVNTIRLVLAFVISLKLHTMICYNGLVTGTITAQEKWMVDWYRLRLRLLVTRQEFEELNDLIPIIGEEHVTKGASFLTPDILEDASIPPETNDIYYVDTTPDMRQPLAILFKMWIEITKHMNEPWGFKERFAKEFLGVCHTCSILFESVTMVVTTPIPFPYVHLCKILLICFLVSTPLVVETELGFFANVILPTAVAMSLLGIDAIATELENPFGDDANDLDIVRGISVLEAECLKLLQLSGDYRALSSFTHVQIPEAFREEDAQNPHVFLCLCTQWRDDGCKSVSVSFQEGDTFGLSGRKGQKNQAEDMDDPRRPLLSDEMAGSINASSQCGFVPMQEFGTGTIDLEEDGTKKALDVVGLDDEDDRGSAGGGSSRPIDNGIFRPGPKSQSASIGPADSKGQSQSITASIGSKGGFRPMGEFGTETVQLAEAADDDGGGIDVVGLSDDEDEPRKIASAQRVILEDEELRGDDRFVPLPLGSASSVHLAPL